MKRFQVNLTIVSVPEISASRRTQQNGRTQGWRLPCSYKATSEPCCDTVVKTSPACCL
jgi:hypothetical protein